MSEAYVGETTTFDPVSAGGALSKSPYVATAAEAAKNYEENRGRKWYKDDADPDDHNGKYAFQRLRQTWFAPKINPKFKLSRDNKFYAIGSCSPLSRIIP